MKPNLTKTKLLSGTPALGIICSSEDPMLAEWSGLLGFDYYILDGEHGLFNPANAVNVVRGCELTGMTPLVRLGSKDPKLVLQYMDAGFMGVMMPGLDTTDQVRMLIDAIKYPPVGKRGLGPIRANDYHMGAMSQADYVGFANQHTMVITQFEDPALLPALPGICALEGLDAVMIGPRDLSLVMGYKDGPNHPEVQDVIDKAIGIITQAGKIAGITARDRAGAENQIARGAGMILNSFNNLVYRGARDFLGKT